jgi:hypothetical protein
MMKYTTSPNTAMYVHGSRVLIAIGSMVMVCLPASSNMG